MSKTTLSLPPLGAIQDKAVVSALQAINSWAKAVPTTYVAKDDLVLEKTTASVTRAVLKEVSQQVDSAVRQYVQVQRTPSEIVRSILSNSGTEPPVILNAPVAFRAGTSATGVTIGAGGLGGTYNDQVTWAISSDDGSFFFGADANKQINFDATTGVFQFGKDIVIQRGSGITLDGTVTAALNASSSAAAALEQLGGKLNKSGSDILSGNIAFTAAGGFKAGNITIDAQGNVTGTGVAFTQKGIVAANSAGVQMTITTDGNATFKGTVETGSYIKSLGSVMSSTAGYYISVVGNESKSAQVGVGGYAGSICGVIGYSNTSGAYGVWGLGATAGTVGVRAEGRSGSPALQVVGPMTIDNSTLVANLNADYLDGYSSGDFFRYTTATAGTITPNYYITVTAGGLTFKVPVQYP